MVNGRLIGRDVVCMRRFLCFLRFMAGFTIASKFVYYALIDP